MNLSLTLGCVLLSVTLTVGSLALVLAGHRRTGAGLGLLFSLSTGSWALSTSAPLSALGGLLLGAACAVVLLGLGAAAQSPPSGQSRPPAPPVGGQGRLPRARTSEDRTGPELPPPGARRALSA